MCRTVAQSHCSARTGHSGKQRQRDCARVLAQASTCGVRKIESPMGHGLDQEADSDAIYIQNCYIYISLKACHAMPCHVLPGPALLVTPSHQAFAFPSTCLYSTYRIAGFGLGAQFGEERGYISLFSVHDSRGTPINQGGI